MELKKILFLFILVFPLTACTQTQPQSMKISPEVENQQSEIDRSKAEKAIREFMNVPDLKLEYISTSKNPSNFTVGKTTVIDDGAFKIDTPPEWKRPVYVFQQEEYINDRCEVYEYEVSVDSNQLVEVHIVYPEEIQNQAPTGDGPIKCDDYESLEVPLKSKAEIEASALTYLQRGVTDFDKIKDELIYTPSKKDPVNSPAANEWSWQDDEYAWPEGWSGENPRVRVIMSSGGKLISYYNNLSLFTN
ncbi:MAG: hypothetical protein BWY51_00153 [Parcubacteria group bacterium ADurb.Bin316]|nr:MAG: hypothetical protein BWY51_00153 [Parcubacteria group bacterium ADurb.Bin316]HOZ55758.1 hypothetical protein [bacterium]